MNKKYKNFDTVAIHGGKTKPNPDKALNPPIFMTSTFTFDTIDDVRKVMAFESNDYVYTRGNNPTLRLFEDRIAEMEEGNGAVAFGSGMGAITGVLLSLLKPGDEVIAHRTIYGSAHSTITDLFPKYNIENQIIDIRDLESLEKAITEKTKVIYFETPANPNLDIVDIEAVVKIAKAKNVKVVVDNTFATPYITKPLTMGVDVVVHSATKYLCGHGDVVAGVAISKDENYVAELKFGYMCELGSALSPFNAWLLLRGMKTLSIRMKQHMANAMELAKFLENHPKVEKVFYPGLESFRGHEIAKKQMNGFGAVISFEIKGALKDAEAVVNATELMQLAVSLGDCETLIEVPAGMTHLGYNKEKLAEFGLTESMIRISVGIEDVEDIIADIEQALDKI